MPRKKTNLWQDLARGFVRGFIDEVINQDTPQVKQPKVKKTKQGIKSKSKRSRYISKSVRVAVFRKDNFKCVFCGRSSKQVELQIDHIYPFGKGGSNEIDNLQTLCIDCNQGKSDQIF